MQTQQLAVPPVQIRHEEAVKGTYDIISIMLKYGGIYELSEGCYQGDQNRSYTEAQQLQQKHLLNLTGLKRGDHLFDIGCGHGVLLQEAKRQGIINKGITLSRKQFEDHRDLDTYLLNWRQIPEKRPNWENQFDAVCAIGSLEHFVSPREVADNLKEKIYLSFFRVCRWLLKPGGRLVVTAIHYRPELVLCTKNAQNQYYKPWRWFSGQFHLGTLAWLGGSYYPIVDELPPIAESIGFSLDFQEDGTKDYFFTSEHWLNELKNKMLKTSLLREILHEFKVYPFHTTYGLLCLLLFQSWNWQFRGNGDDPPTKLLRYVWKKK